jgi:tyrosinase
MQAIDAKAFIPCWQWTEDRSIPSGIVGFKPTVLVPGQGLITVSRNPENAAELPTPARITGILALTTYTAFTSDLESRPHNRVHMWVNGTMSNITVSPADPLFWMHHAMLDRIWALWESKTGNSGKGPSLAGSARTMDPWTETATQVQSIGSLDYEYEEG